jgi:hypothetical protein
MSIVDDNHGVYPTQKENPLDANDGTSDSPPALVGSASMLILNECDDEVSRKTSFANRIKDQVHRRYNFTLNK